MSPNQGPNKGPHILLLATCDTKLEEITYVHTQLRTLSPQARLTLLDIGRSSVSNPLINTSARSILPQTDLTALSRGDYSATTIPAATCHVRSLHTQTPLHGAIAIGGSTGSSISAAILREALPIGLPKLLVSTMASGDVGPLVGAVDMTLMYSVVDIAGLNFLSRQILANAAAATAGMAGSYHETCQQKQPSSAADEKGNGGKGRRKRIAITMFGVTTPGVDAIRAMLTAKPHHAEVVVFHATGSGGRAMETLITQGAFDGVIDLTTTEIADEIGGGVLSAGPDRLAAGADAGVPMVVSVGACDMLNFGPRESLRQDLAEAGERGERRVYVHNPAVTLVRTTAEENRRIAEFMVQKLRGARRRDRIRVLLPTEGVSMISGKDGPYEDREADEVLFRGIEEGLKDSGVVVERHRCAINDQEFVEKVVEAFVHVQGIS